MHRLAHPFIVSLHSTFESDRCLYMVMQYASGGSLAYRFETCPPDTWQPNVVRTMFAEVLLALAYLHSQRVIYRDLKPENTLIGGDGHLLLADFGVSKALGEAASAHVAGFSADSQVGTLPYMSPEQRAHQSYSFEVDYWAFGAFLHEALTMYSVWEASAAQPAISLDLLEPSAADLISKLLVYERESRLGFGERAAEHVKAHAYFAGVDFEAVGRKEVAPPLQAEQVTMMGAASSHGAAPLTRRCFMRPTERSATSSEPSSREVTEDGLLSPPVQSSATSDGS